MVMDSFPIASRPELCTKLCSRQICLSVHVGVSFLVCHVQHHGQAGKHVSKQQKAAWRPVKTLWWLVLVVYLLYSLSFQLGAKFGTMFERCLDGDGRYFVVAHHCIALQCRSEPETIHMPTAESFDPGVNANCDLSHYIKKSDVSRSFCAV